jgi:hypothetical protein
MTARWSADLVEPTYCTIPEHVASFVAPNARTIWRVDARIGGLIVFRRWVFDVANAPFLAHPTHERYGVPADRFSS